MAPKDGRDVDQFLAVDVVKTRGQILCSIRLKCVSKNLMPRRMLKNSFLIAQIIPWNNSFQNMYDML